MGTSLGHTLLDLFFLLFFFSFLLFLFFIDYNIDYNIVLVSFCRSVPLEFFRKCFHCRCGFSTCIPVPNSKFRNLGHKGSASKKPLSQFTYYLSPANFNCSSNKHYSPTKNSLTANRFPKLCRYCWQCLPLS